MRTHTSRKDSQFIWFRCRLTGYDTDKPPPRPDVEWIDMKGRQTRLTLKFIKAGRPAIMLVARDSHLQTIMPASTHQQLFL